MDVFGSFALLLAFLAAVYAFGGGIAGIITRRPLLTKSARNAGMAVFGLITLAVGALEYFFFTDNFSLAYVAEHSNRALPAFYKFAALWAGQEGSLLVVELAAFDLRVFRAVPQSQEASGADAVRRRDSGRACRFSS